MTEFDGKLIEMTLEGDFVNPPSHRPPWLTRLAGWAALIAVLAGITAFLVFSLWIVAALIPVMVIGGLIAYAALRLQRWRRG